MQNVTICNTRLHKTADKRIVNVNTLTYYHFFPQLRGLQNSHQRNVSAILSVLDLIYVLAKFML